MLRVFLLLLLASSATPALADGKLPLRILYLGNDQNRSRDFGDFFNQHFSFATAQTHADFDRDEFDRQQFDVVVIDWSQRETSSADAVSPVGDREAWSTPTVLLGSAGHLLAAAWEVAGGSG